MKSVEPWADKRWPVACFLGPWLLHDSLRAESGKNADYVTARRCPRGAQLYEVFNSNCIVKKNNRLDTIISVQHDLKIVTRENS